MRPLFSAPSCAALALLIATATAAGQEAPAAPAHPTDYSVMRFIMSSLDGQALPEVYVKHTVGLLASSLGGIDEEHGWSRDLFLMLKADGKIRFDDLVAEDDSITRRLEERLLGAAANGAFVPLPCAGCDSLAIAVRVLHAARPRDVPAYFEFQVEKSAIPRSPSLPQYPPALRSSGTSGHVLVQFVVGTDGRAEMSTFKVLEATDPAFADAARNAVRTSSYFPAEIGGKKVRQVVQQPFTFETP